MDELRAFQTKKRNQKSEEASSSSSSKLSSKIPCLIPDEWDVEILTDLQAPQADGVILMGEDEVIQAAPVHGKTYVKVHGHWCGSLNCTKCWRVVKWR